MARELPTVVLAGGLLATSTAACQTVDHGAFGPFMRSLNDTPHGHRVVDEIPAQTVYSANVKRAKTRERLGAAP